MKKVNKRKLPKDFIKIVELIFDDFELDHLAGWRIFDLGYGAGISEGYREANKIISDTFKRKYCI